MHSGLFIGAKVNFDGETGTKDYKFVKWLSKNKVNSLLTLIITKQKNHIKV